MDDKRYVLNNNVTTLAHGHYKINDLISIRCNTPESDIDSFTNISLSPMLICENDFVHIN